ncbi:MAG: hypothetical protein ACOX5X_04710 [Acholeplasmataceae bacterium]|jgi:uncharacterized oligopeptide transporter (OPT) family protein
MKLAKQIISYAGILFGVISIVFYMQALIKDQCNPLSGIFLAVSIILFTVENLLGYSERKEKKEDSDQSE